MLAYNVKRLYHMAHASLPLAFSLSVILYCSLYAVDESGRYRTVTDLLKCGIV